MSHHVSDKFYHTLFFFKLAAVCLSWHTDLCKARSTTGSIQEGNHAKLAINKSTELLACKEPGQGTEALTSSIMHNISTDPATTSDVHHSNNPRLAHFNLKLATDHPQSLLLLEFQATLLQLVQ
jgi:hypothetical protein